MKRRYGPPSVRTPLPLAEPEGRFPNDQTGWRKPDLRGQPGTARSGETRAAPATSRNRTEEALSPWAEAVAREPEDALSLYVHIPYCAHRCAFCDLSAGRPHTPEEPLAYLTAVRREIVRTATEDERDLASRPAVSVYFGGGTPTSVQPEGLCGILWLLRNQFAVTRDAEVTVEADPATVTEESLWALRQGGFGRISFGVQTLDDRVLRRIGRLHDAARARDSVRWAHEQGFEEISIDLIMGLPEVGMATFLDGIREVLDWPIRHVSLYALQVEEGTPFGRRQRAGRLGLPPDDLVVEMGDRASALLEGAGFARYELSSFARSGSRSRHNEGYWTGRAYRGFGAGAHSFVGRTRFWNVRRPTQYITDVVAGQSPVAGREVLSSSDLASEALWLSLRRTEGVDRSRFAARFGFDPVEALGPAIRDLEAGGFVRVSTDHVALTGPGRWLYNRVAVRLMDALDAMDAKGTRSGADLATETNVSGLGRPVGSGRQEVPDA